MKIEKLTPEQEAAIPRYRDEGITMGLSTKTNREMAEAAVPLLYEKAGLKAPSKIVWARSPLELQKIANELNGTTKEFYYPCWGCQDSFFLKQYEFFRNECGLVEETELLQGLHNISQHVGWFVPFDEAIILSENPIEINLNEDKRLHKDLGAAITWSDGYKVYALNGVRMQEEHVMTPAEDLNPLDALREPNVEIRRELIRKIGLGRCVDKMNHKVLDEDVINGAPYRLLSIEISEGNFCPFLDMMNQSVEGVRHIEGVAPGIMTCKEALNWRDELEETFGLARKDYVAPLLLT